MAFMELIIALDLGNINSFPCYIPVGDVQENGFGGRPVDLLPRNGTVHYGFPSVFFYSKEAADRCKDKTQAPPWCGFDAIKSRAMPKKNRVVNLKRMMGRELVLDDWHHSYDDAIVLMIQYLMRKANETLRMDTMRTTNLLSLSYPATFTTVQIRHLKDLAEKATLEDGTHVRVVSMIAEPAAGALEYLVESKVTDRDSTVLTYDLGGGTFDLAVVTSFPQGRLNKAGEIYYYDIDKTGGIQKLGGTDFDRVMADLIRSRLPAGIKLDEDTLLSVAENTKIELSGDTESYVDVIAKDGTPVDLTVTLEEFEKAARPLLMRTVEETRRVLDESIRMGKKPEAIVLTGGASQMPMVRQALEQALPEYRGKVKDFNPSKAIAYGAARYGMLAGSAVRKHVTHDVGIRFYDDDDSDNEHVTVYIPRGKELPFTSEYVGSCTRVEGASSSQFTVMEAKNDDPDYSDPDGSFVEIMSVTLDRGKPVPKGTKSETRLIVDGNGILTVEARDPARPGKPPVTSRCQLKNLS